MRANELLQLSLMKEQQKRKEEVIEIQSIPLRNCNEHAITVKVIFHIVWAMVNENLFT